MRLLALLAACLFAGAVMAAPVPKETGKDLYFPVVKGTKAVLVSKVGDATTETIETVTAVESKDGVYTVTLESDMGGGRVSTRTVEVSGKGLVQKAINGKEGKEPTPLLKTGSKPGDTWSAEVPAPGGQGKRTFTQGKEEEVEVPAGKFQAVRVDSETTTDRGVSSKGTQWYALRVGLVKSVIANGGRETTHELKEFTPGKNDEKKVKDEEAILGVWGVSKFDNGTGTFPADATLARMRYTFTKDGKQETVGGDGVERSDEYKLDPTAKPKAIDITVKGVVYLGVYEVDGDTLTICTSQDIKTRPTELKAVKDKFSLTVLKRCKDEKKDK